MGVPLLGTSSSASCATFPLSDRKIVVSVTHHLVVVVTSFFISIITNVYLALRRDSSRPSPLKLCSHVFATLSAAACTAFAIHPPAVRPPLPASAKTEIRMSRCSQTVKRTRIRRQLMVDQTTSTRSQLPKYRCPRSVGAWGIQRLPNENRSAIKAMRALRSQRKILAISL